MYKVVGRTEAVGCCRVATTASVNALNLNEVRVTDNHGIGGPPMIGMASNFLTELVTGIRAFVSNTPCAFLHMN